MRLRHILLVLVALVLAVAAGCGVPVDDEPRAIAGVPDDLLEQTTTTTTVAPSLTETTVTVFLIGPQNRVVPVERSVRDETSLAIFDALLEPPTDEQAARGLDNAIPNSTVLNSPPILEDRVLQLDLSGGITDLTGERALNALAQIVYTYTNQRGIDAIRFGFDGAFGGVLIDGLEIAQGPVDRFDYETRDPDFEPPTTPAPTTTSTPPPPQT